jgi:protein-disulfide isomerase
MKTNRLVTVLVSATLLLQTAILYKQYRASNASSQRPARPTVTDAPKDATLEVTGLPITGDPGAKVVLVEFSDYQCPFCKRHATGVGRELEQKFVATGKIRHAFVNNPLAIHSNARLLATAAICAKEQGHFWEMYDTLFQTVPKTKSEILLLTTSVVMDSNKFAACLDRSDEAEKQIKTDLELANKFQFTGTPSFAVGVVDVHGKVSIKKFIVGAQPLSVFEKTIDELLSLQTPAKG